MSEQTNYYAIIPADVRYCKDLTPSAKLLYGEITALANKEGFCWASNSYFGELYGVDARTIQRWLLNLKKCGFIYIENEPKDGSTLRKIFHMTKMSLPVTKTPYPMTKMPHPYDKDAAPPYDKNATQIIQHINNTKNSMGEITSPSAREGKKRQRFKPPTLEEVKAYISEKNLNVDAQRFFDYFEAGDWHDSKGNPVRNWKQKIITWAKHEPEKKGIDPAPPTEPKAPVWTPEQRKAWALEEIQRRMSGGVENGRKLQRSTG